MTSLVMYAYQAYTTPKLRTYKYKLRFASTRIDKNFNCDKFIVKLAFFHNTKQSSDVGFIW